MKSSMTQKSSVLIERSGRALPLKKIVVAFTFILSVTGAFAQKIDKAKDLLEKKKYNEAKTEIDNVLAQEKFKNNAEAWYVKGKVNSTIAADSTLAATDPGAKDAALGAFKKYMELESGVKDSAKRFMLLTLDNRKPITDLYSSYSKQAASFYNAGNYNDALKGFQGSLSIFDLLSKQGWTGGIKLDTISVLYAGISAEKGNKLDTAAQYYGMIADAKAKAQGYESIYKWLADYYKTKGDLVNAEKYTKLGKEVYPEDPFWNTFELAMVDKNASPEQLFAKYDEVLKQDPKNHAIWYNYAAELYNTAYNEDTTKRPANTKEYLDNAAEKVKKSLEIKSDYPNSHYLHGVILTAQADLVDKKNKLIRPPKGGKLKPEEMKQKEDLRGEMKTVIDSAITEFETVDNLIGKSGKLKMEDKQMLKDTYDRLIIFYEQRKDDAKTAAYTDKFNSVDKVH